MRQNLHELPEPRASRRRMGRELVFVQHLCHDFGESSAARPLPPDARIRRRADAAGRRSDRDRSLLRRGASLPPNCGIELRLPRTQPRPEAGAQRPRAMRLALDGGLHQLRRLRHAVLHGGDARPCELGQHPEGRALAEVWDSAAYRAFRSALASGTSPRDLSHLRRLQRHLLHPHRIGLPRTQFRTNDMAAIDILLPTCGRPASLVMTLAGIASQTFTDLRVIVADQVARATRRRSGCALSRHSRARRQR